MGDLVDLLIGGITLYLFVYALPLINASVSMSEGEKFITVLIIGYAALFGVRIGANALENILTGTIKWLLQTDFGKSIAARIRSA